jgi:hypothetical protein
MAMSKVLSEESLDLVFRQARTHNVWLDKPVDDTLLQQVYDLARMGPPSTPGIQFPGTEAGRLLPAEESRNGH